MRVAPNFEALEFTQVNMLVKGCHPAFIPQHLAISQDPFAKLVQVVIEGYVQVHPTHDEPPYLGLGMPWIPPPPPADHDEDAESNSDPLTSVISQTNSVTVDQPTGECSSRFKQSANGEDNWKHNFAAHWLTHSPKLPLIAIYLSKEDPLVLSVRTLSDSSKGLHLSSRAIDLLPAPRFETFLLSASFRFLTFVQFTSLVKLNDWVAINGTKNFRWALATIKDSELNFPKSNATGLYNIITNTVAEIAQQDLSFHTENTHSLSTTNTSSSPPGFSGPPMYLTEVATLEEVTSPAQTSSPPGFPGPPKYLNTGKATKMKKKMGPVRRSPRLNSPYIPYCQPKIAKKPKTSVKPSEIYNLKRAPLSIAQAETVISTAGFDITPQLQKHILATFEQH